MFARLLSSLLLLMLVLGAGHLARPVSLDGIDLSPDARILASSRISPSAPIGAGDRIIAVGGHEVFSAQQVTDQLSATTRRIDVRVLSLANPRSESVEASMLQGDLPEILLPTYFIVSLDDQSAFGASSADVARALQNKASIRVTAVPTAEVFDGEMRVRRGLPPWTILVALAVAMLSLAILWGMSLPLGLTLGLASAGTALWLLEGHLSARFVGLAAICLSAAFGAWTVIQLSPQRANSQRGRAKRYEGSTSRPDLLAALHESEETLGIPLYLVVGSAQQAVEIKREYERISVSSADSILTSTLSLLALEGGVFPRADVGDGVPQVWDDPIHDLDVSAGIAGAVPIPAYGSSQDQWAFLITRTKDTPCSPAMLEPLLAIAEWWAESGVREAIAVQAAHGLLRLVREAKNTNKVVPHSIVADGEAFGASTGAAGDSRSAIPGAPVIVANPNLDAVSEGIGIPRVMKRADLEKERGEWIGHTPTTRAPESPPALLVQSSAPAPSLAGIRTARGKNSDMLLAAEKAWSGHLERRWEDQYPVDDPRLFSEEDWSRLAKLRSDERPCLLYGEPGVGKEFAARALHDVSDRGRKPIAVVDCARMAESSVELELFGLSGDPGVIGGLEGGALILKSPSKLSRSLLESTLRQLARLNIRLFLIERHAGSGRGLPPTTPTAVREKVEQRVVRIPPLRERPEDIVPIANVMLEELSSVYGSGEFRGLDDMAERFLESMDLPGNFWDLHSLIRSALLRADEDMIDVRAILGVSAGDMPRELAKIEADEERQRLVAALHETEGNKSEAARILGLSRGALLRRLKRHGLM